MNFGFFHTNRAASNKRPAKRTNSPRRNNRLALSVEHLEDRQMMSAVPILNSLPGAPKTIYLDFDGDVQAVWNRTDTPQKYTNVNSGRYDKDGQLGFNGVEQDDIRAIWQGVAEDYAPFNVNVTTVEPAAAAFQANQAMRVVIGGTESATLNGKAVGGGNQFMTEDGGKSYLDTSGYSSIGCFSDAEPNVVFVFAGYINTNTWANTDAEGRPRDKNALIANTASHELGHAFGLEHHSTYDAKGKLLQERATGDSLTTPIMGENTSADRTMWSKSLILGGKIQDCVQILADKNKLGARLDDYGDSFLTAHDFPVTQFKYGQAQTFAQGVISTTSDTDWFHISTNGGDFQFNADPVKFANLDVQLELYQQHTSGWGDSYVSLIASRATVPSCDPPILAWNQPFTGLNASLSMTLAKGDYFVVVKSHDGAYGDLGQYTLHMTRSDAPPLQVPLAPIAVLLPQVPIRDPGPMRIDGDPWILQSRLSDGIIASQLYVTLQTPMLKATDLAFADLAITPKITLLTTATLKTATLKATDLAFADWG